MTIEPNQHSGLSIALTGDEVATAIIMFLESKGITIKGPRTVTVNDVLCQHGDEVYVDPSGTVVAPTGEWSAATGSIIGVPVVDKACSHVFQHVVAATGCNEFNVYECEKCGKQEWM